jgi:hypothetical protein
MVFSIICLAKTLKNWWKNIHTQKSYAKKTGRSDTF